MVITAKQNRRCEERRDVTGNIEINVEDEENIKGELLNINRKGIAFLANKPLIEKGLCHFLRFSLLEQNDIKNVKGRIIRQEKVDNGYLTAMVFISISEQTRSIISKYLGTISS